MITRMRKRGIAIVPRLRGGLLNQQPDNDRQDLDPSGNLSKQRQGFGFSRQGLPVTNHFF